MRVVVADATPLHYLILIGAIEVLPRIFEKIHIPVEVRDELSCEAAPPDVRAWMRQPPVWLEVAATPFVVAEDPALETLDSGERAAIILAESIRADLLLIDDRGGSASAATRPDRNRNFGHIGPGFPSGTPRFARRIRTTAENQFSLPALAHGNASGRRREAQETRNLSESKAARQTFSWVHFEWA